MSRDRYVVWTEQDMSYLRANYDRQPVGDTARNLNRSLACLYAKAKQMGLRGRKKCKAKLSAISDDRIALLAIRAEQGLPLEGQETGG